MENYNDDLFISLTKQLLNNGISSTSRIEQFAINDLIVSNPGYDVILFPQFEVKKKWFLIGSKTHVEVKARLAKLTPNNQ